MILVLMTIQVQAKEELIHELPAEDYIIFSCVCLFLVLMAGLMSGLTVGLLSIDELDLEMKLANGTDQEKAQARRVLPIISKHHLLLVTLLLANAVCMEALPIFLDEMFGKVVAILLSVSFVLAFGEVLPQALCTGPNQLKIASRSVPVVKFFMVLLLPISYPIAKGLDKCLGVGHSKKYKNEDLKTLITLHQSFQKDPKESIGLVENQIKIIHGAIDMNKELVKDHMIPYEKVYVLSNETVLNKRNLREVVSQGFSRIPVFKGSNRDHILGLLLVKKLVGIDEGEVIGGIPLRKPIYVHPAESILELLGIFQEGKSHMAIVTENPLNPQAKNLGIITLEDVFELILKSDILDEDDYDKISQLLSVPRKGSDHLVRRAVGRRPLTLRIPQFEESLL